jgi:hypothetical protein
MALLDFFRSKGRLSGTVILIDLPECAMLSVNIHPFRVSEPSAPLPYSGEPPGSAYTCEISVREAEQALDKPLTFSVDWPVGYYHLDVGVIAYREVEGKMYAHVEHFFPLPRPCQVVAGKECSVHLSVRWPSTPIDQLPRYGTVNPRGTGGASDP